MEPRREPCAQTPCGTARGSGHLCPADLPPDSLSHGACDSQVTLWVLS